MDKYNTQKTFTKIKDYIVILGQTTINNNKIVYIENIKVSKGTIAIMQEDEKKGTTSFVTITDDDLFKKALDNFEKNDILNCREVLY